MKLRKSSVLLITTRSTIKHALEFDSCLSDRRWPARHANDFDSCPSHTRSTIRYAKKTGSGQLQTVIEECLSEMLRPSLTKRGNSSLNVFWESHPDALHQGQRKVSLHNAITFACKESRQVLEWRSEEAIPMQSITLLPVNMSSLRILSETDPIMICLSGLQTFSSYDLSDCESSSVRDLTQCYETLYTVRYQSSLSIFPPKDVVQCSDNALTPDLEFCFKNAPL